MAPKRKRGQGEGAAATFSVGDFDDAQPQAFYLLDNAEGLQALADTTLVVADKKMPAHSQVRDEVGCAWPHCAMVVQG